uniref:Uncharacterized protein n=1 Tax=Steinernema glaseri TaxID=37863 RepID=A0A1I8A7H6_9BILA
MLSEEQEARKKHIERKMSERSEALKTKRLATPRKAKFDASETAQIFVDLTNKPDAPRSPVSPRLHIIDTDEEEKKQFAALSEWINHLVGTDFYDTSEVEALMAKTKNEAAKYLRDMLVNSGKTRVSMETKSKEDVSYEALLKERKKDLLKTRFY